MTENLDLKAVEKKVYLSFTQDGLWDIAVGWLVLIFGLEMLLHYFMLVPVIIIPFLLLPSLKKAITMPRMGYVQFNPERRRWVRFWMGVLTFILSGTALAGVVVMYAFASESTGFRAWFENYGGLTAVLVIALAAYATGQVTGVKRYNWYTGLILGLLALFLLFPIPGEWFGVILGSVITFTGIVLLVLFIRKYPLTADEGLIGEADDAGA
jgi:hypothetical protein